jgi:hypothetical protein
VLEELDALEPLKKEALPQGIKALGTHLFTIEKFTASGEPEKFKSQLVSHGSEQDALLHLDRSSPTVSVHAIMTCLAIAACNRLYTFGKIDVKGAFIKTEMSGPPVYVKCTGKVREVILAMYPHLQEFVGSDRVLYCKLKKALYGCVQTSKLWYEKLRKFLQAQVYVRCVVDPCVFRKVVGSDVYLLLVYVDDILIRANAEELARLEKEFVCMFKWITMSLAQVILT